MIHSRSKFLLWPGLLVLLLAGSLTLALTHPTPQVNIDRDWRSGSPHPVTDETAQAGVLETYSNLPLAFIANRGQTDSRVRFTARGAGHTFYFTPTEVVFDAIQRLSGQAEEDRMAPAREPRLDEPLQRAVVRMRFLRVNPNVVVEGLEELPGRANFFIGNDPTKWQTDVPTYAAVAYRDLYPGVDLIYRGSGGRLKSEFRVAPGTDPGVIRLSYVGAGSLTVNKTGQLVIRTALGELLEEAPYIYQEVAGERVEVTGQFRLTDEGTVSFAVSNYNPNSPLVIDPILAYSTFLGGNASDQAVGVAVDSEGYAYVAGYTWSTNFPTVNPLQPNATQHGDAFFAKIDPSSGALVYSTYLGGNNNDYGYGIAVDQQGYVYVIGRTASTNFPTVNAAQNSKGGHIDAFVAKVNALGSSIAFSTYLGGSDGDYGNDIAVDDSANAYVTGYTESTDFPIVNAIQPNYIAFEDAFVTKIDTVQGAFAYSTYLGGSSLDYGYGVAVDDLGNTYVTGHTSSTDFPTVNAIQADHLGHEDVFVTKIDASAGLVYSTYLGGSSSDYGYDIAVDSENNVYVTGRTGSSDFPVANSLQANNAGGYDAFVAKIETPGSRLVYSTYLGGSGSEFGWGIALDSIGNIHVTGKTESDDYPTVNPLQVSYGGGYLGDAFVAKIGVAGDALIYSTYLGGQGSDYGWDIAVGEEGTAYVVGITNSADFPLVNPTQSYGGGDRDAFIAKIRTFGAQLSSDKLASGGPPWLPGETVQYTIQISNTVAAYDDAQDVHMDDLVPSNLTVTGVFCTDGTCSHVGNDINWDIASLAVGASANVTITATINLDVDPGTTIENCAVATSPTDPDPPFPTCVSFTTAVADLSISKAATGANLPWMPGEPVRYTVQVSNAADAELDAQNVHLDDLVPGSLAVTGLSCSAGACNYAGNDVDWDMSVLPIGETVTMTIDTTIDAGIPLTTTVENCATITSPTDPDPPSPACYSFVAVNCPTSECGKIKEDTVWTSASSPYTVIGDLIINEGVTLTIEPGVEVRVATSDALSSGEDPDKVELIVAGTLIADGVTFTSNADTPAAGDWYGIRFLPSSTDWDGSGGSIITNSTIEYGTVGISIDGASPMIDNNILTDMKGKDGIGGSTYDDSCDNIDGEDSSGIHIINVSAPTVIRNTIARISGGAPGYCRYYIYGGFFGVPGDAIGISVNGSSPTITDNDISDVGGSPAIGIYLDSASSPTVTRNIIHDVYGIDGWGGSQDFLCRGGTIPGQGGRGVGIQAQSSSAASITDNVVNRIRGGKGGGGSFSPYGCNIRGANGGLAAGIYVEDSSVALINNTIVTTIGGGGGRAGRGRESPSVYYSSDDAREFSDGDYDDTEPKILLGDHQGLKSYVGFRFPGLSIGQGAVIDAAALTITACESSSLESGVSTQFLMKGEDIGDSPTFSADNSPRDRMPTVAGVIWTVTEDWIQSQTYSSPDLASVIQEIVSREDWQAGSALTLLVLDAAIDNQHRMACAWDGDPREAAQLTITWHIDESDGRDGVGMGIDASGSSIGTSMNHMAGASPSTFPPVTITNSIVVSHTIGISGTTTTATLAYNDVWDNSQANYAGLPPGANDISVDPLFRDTTGNDYHLCAGSPLIDAGTNQGAPATDIDGDVRPYDGDNEGVAVTDIGADEWLPGPAFLTVLPSTLNFVGTVGKQDPKPQGIDIFNCGSRDTFQWTANTDAPWLHVCPLSGVTTGTATVFVDTGGLGMGRYTGTITVTSQTAGVLNSPQAISTTLEVVPLGDVDADCDVDVADVMEVVSRWRLQAGDPNYLAACDVNDDKTINVADIQKVVTQWGIICPQGYSVTRAAPKATDEQSWCGQHLLGDRNH